MQLVQKFAKGFVFGGLASLVTVLGASGCGVKSVDDLRAFSMSAVAGFLAGGAHAVWYAYFNQSQQPE